MRRIAAAARHYATYLSRREAVIKSLVRESRSLVNEGNQRQLIEKALDAHLWALAAKFCGSFWPALPSHTILKRIVGGLVLYDPRLTPLHTRTLGLLFQQYSAHFSLDPSDKSRLIESAMRYASKPGAVTSSDIVEKSFRLAVAAPGGPIPVWTLHSLLRECHKLWLFSCIGSVWRYMRAEWPVHCLDYTPLVAELMIACAQTRRQRAIAKDMSWSLMDRVRHDPVVELAVAKVALKLGHAGIFAELNRRVGNPKRPVLGIMLLWYLDRGDAQNMRRTLKKIGTLTSKEAAAVVRSLASKDLQHAEDFLKKAHISSPDRSNAYFELLNAAVDQGDPERVDIYRKKCKPNGATLSVCLKWEVEQQGFEAARQLYLSWDTSISQKSRAVCLRFLAQCAREKYDSEWVLSEALLRGVPIRPLENVINSCGEA